MYVIAPEDKKHLPWQRAVQNVFSSAFDLSVVHLHSLSRSISCRRTAPQHFPHPRFNFVNVQFGAMKLYWQNCQLMDCIGHRHHRWQFFGHAERCQASTWCRLSRWLNGSPEHQGRLLGSRVRFLAGAFAIVSVSAKASLPMGSIHLYFARKASGGHSKARETRDAQFLQKFTRFALIGRGPARPRVCKCPPPRIPLSQSPF